MFDLDALIANKDLILKDRDNRADVQKVLSVYAEKVDDDYTVKAKWSDIFSALLQGMKVQAQVITIGDGGEPQSIFEGDVTTTGSVDGNLGVFAAEVTAETITVTFDGTEYTLSRTEVAEGIYAYGGIGEGGPDFTNYPFCILYGYVGSTATLYTETAGTYSLKIEGGASSSAVIETYDLYDATVTESGFKVNGTDLSASGADAYPVGSLSRPSSGGGGEGGGVLMCTKEKHVDGDDVYYTLDHTWQEIKDAGFAVVNGSNHAVCPLVQIAEGGDGQPYAVVFLDLSTNTPATFTAQSADDYPVFYNGGDDVIPD